MAQPKKHHASAQTKVKLSQKAKKRRRKPKGTGGGQFTGGGIPQHNLLPKIFKHSVVGLSGNSVAYEGDTPKGDPDETDVNRASPRRRSSGANPQSSRRKRLGSGSINDEFALAYEAKFNELFRGKQGQMSRNAAHEEAISHAMVHTYATHNQYPRPSFTDQYRQAAQPPEPGGISGRQETPEEAQGRVDTEKLWFGNQGTYPGSDTPGALRPETRVPKGKDTPSQAFRKLPKSEQEWVKGQNAFQGFQGRVTPRKGERGGPEGGDPGAKKRFENYTNARQAGYSAEDALHYAQNVGERRGRPSATGAQPSKHQIDVRRTANQDIEKRLRPEATGRKDKYGTGAPSHESFGYGIQVPGIDSRETIQKNNPEWSDAEVSQYREAQRSAVNSWLVTNQRMAHESRRANLMGKKGSEAGPGDRVVFFTTNLGSPAPSVPANSLLGQYVIKKRKKMLSDTKRANRWDLKGQYPEAVRDQHLIEISTGFTVGSQGRYGAYRNIGWRKGSKTSKGYGKQVPVGTKILRDTNNMPVYDKNGNIRYTEGYTRPYSVGARDVGLRIYMG